MVKLDCNFHDIIFFDCRKWVRSDLNGFKKGRVAEVCNLDIMFPFISLERISFIFISGAFYAINSQ
jgi:hypothetical protein